MATPQSPPRRSRGFSVKSDPSQHSEKSTGHKRGPSESSEEKARRNLHTKADPLLAMNEAQPSEEAQKESNLGSLRAYPHKDQFGNIITDPDLSNPTRPRLERPLDTIRSFEKAIYGNYGDNRRSYARTEDASQMGAFSPRTEDASSQMGAFSRGTSYYGAQNGPSAQYQNGRDNRQNYSGRRQDGIVNDYQHSPQSPEYFSEDQYNQYPPQNARERTNNPRFPPPQRVSPNGNPESPYGYYNGYGNGERTYNASNSGTDPYNQSTDPSSINSSYDQLQHAPQHRPDERSPAEYGFDGITSNGYGSPKVPQSVAVPAPMAVPAPAKSSPVPQTPKNEKRKSWFKRRFSKD